MLAPLDKVENRIPAGGGPHPGSPLELSLVFATVVKVAVSLLYGGFRNAAHSTLQQLNAWFCKHSGDF